MTSSPRSGIVASAFLVIHLDATRWHEGAGTGVTRWHEGFNLSTKLKWNFFF